MTGEHHIIHADRQAREDYAVKQIAENPLLLAAVTEPMGLGCFSWYVLGMDTQWTGRKPGDIDILGGKLAWRDPGGLDAEFVQMQERYPDWHPSWHADLAGRSLAQEGGIAWPPSREFLAGVEVKCSYVIDGVGGSTKASRQKVEGIREQIEGLLALGLDRVALLDVIATTPADGQDMHAWLGAASNARIAFATMSDIIAARLPEDTVAGQFVWPVGAVIGGCERDRGASIPRLIRAPQDNPYRTNAIAQRTRTTLSEKLHTLLAILPQPTFFPVVLVCCKTCRAIHRSAEGCADTSVIG